jgi:LacI family transcriptional regulator, repressor for deo operon, udp, cdd, tsx, nupC, and nupG
VHEPNPFTTPRLRRKGYRAALAEDGLELHEEYEVDGEYTTQGGELAMSQLLSLGRPATAVFAQSDRMAFGVLHTLRTLGLSCPDDLSVVGFGDHEVAAAVDLTTVHQPTTEQGAAAARSLLGTLAGGKPSSQLMPTRLVVRASTKPLRRGRP